MVASPTIVVIGHARPGATTRLLKAVSDAHIAAGTPLIVSIDLGNERSIDVLAVAERAEWPHGPLEVVTHDAIGLVAHFHACGDLTQQQGDVVLLEDDLLVGPGFLRWATAALQHANKDETIAGVSLAAPGRDGFRHLPFEPVDDGSDGFYAQIPWYDGIAFSPAMWQRYRSTTVDPATRLHPAFDHIDDGDDWFAQLTRYLVQTAQWWLLPRSAHATGTGAVGTHFDTATDWFQVPLAVRAPERFRFRPIRESRAIYDDHLEPTADMLVRLGLDAATWTIDIRGLRDLTALPSDALVLTTRPCHEAIRSWGSAMHPLELNAVFDHPGAELHLAENRHIDVSDRAAQKAGVILDRHHRRGALARSELLEAIMPGLGSTARRWRKRILEAVRSDR